MSLFLRFVAAYKKPPVFCIITEFMAGGSLGNIYISNNLIQSLLQHVFPPSRSQQQILFAKAIVSMKKQSF
jgi:hypothetical protein